MNLHLKFICTVFLFSAGVFITSCDILNNGPCLHGSGKSKTETRDVASFTGVEMRVGGNVFVTAGPKAEVKVESFANLLPEIVTEVEGKTLVIKSTSCLDYNDNETNVYISLPDIEQATLKTSGVLSIQTVASTKPLQLSLTGSGTIKYTGNATVLKVQHSGSGDVELNGFTSNLETTLSGSGRVMGYFMHADTAQVITSGSGHQQIWVNKVLDANISGSGNIYYRGNPSLVSKLTTGSGKVINDN
ncbi:head GIN domain-containing protein [Rufibacter sediminis]|uniref:DUF2807 domain-containing protein n=1 Tax=Rufibacter sediminis TaxID=2762756 RepID=A0ABR6VZH5_9BACT|nr:head GIN domain-containing protein [Rufibacter sediminis]MBC3542325.1 DUF2807 domain-containing protein [Rufibacter sediminis]